MTRFDETRMQPAKDYAENYVREVTARYIGPRRKGLTISGPGDAASFMRGLLRDEVREHFLALYLNGHIRSCPSRSSRLGTPPRHPSTRVKSFKVHS